MDKVIKKIYNYWLHLIWLIIALSFTIFCIPRQQTHQKRLKEKTVQIRQLGHWSHMNCTTDIYQEIPKNKKCVMLYPLLRFSRRKAKVTKRKKKKNFFVLRHRYDLSFLNPLPRVPIRLNYTALPPNLSPSDVHWAMKSTCGSLHPTRTRPQPIFTPRPPPLQ